MTAKLRRWLAARLRRQLFAVFALVIVLTALTVAGVSWLTLQVSQDGPRPPQLARVVSRQVGRVWDQEAERINLLQEWADEVHTGLVLRDSSGRVVAHAGDTCLRPWRIEPVFAPPHGGHGPRRHRMRPDGTPPPGLTLLGSLEVCKPTPLLPWPLLFAAMAGLLVLWIVAGQLARKLTRPVLAVTAVARDLADGKWEARVALPEQQRDEVAVLGTVLNTMADSVQSQLRQHRELLAAVSHELRTPLQHLRLLVEREKATSGDGPLTDALEREVQELDDLVGQLLANAKLDFRTLTPQPVDLVALAIGLLERRDLDPTLLDSDAGKLMVNGDPTLLQRALANLLDNAERHGQGLAGIHLRLIGREVELQVLDRGPGVQGDPASWFAPFVAHGHDARSLGLGLHLVLRIAEAHGGTATARNRQDAQGACVVVRLPLVG